MRAVFAGALGASVLAGAACAQPASVPTTSVDYGQDASWLCLPGREDACAGDLSAGTIGATGPGEILTFAADPSAPVDCFYVYPTVSADPGDLSDLTPGADEEVRAIQSQAARFRSVCRLYAPMYRQTTLAALNKALRGDAVSDETFGRAYSDVRDAWRRYLEHENGGRGVVLIGHSQGAIHLWRLIAEEIDGKPDQRKLVLALLGGYLPTLKGEAGVRFDSTPFCSDKAQAGCVYVWNSYDAADASPFRAFGRSTTSSSPHPCVNPAAPGGGQAPVKALLPAPGQTPPRVLDSVAMRAGCVTDAEGSVLKVSVEPVPYAPAVRAYLTAMQPFPTWGLHRFDMGVVQGDLLDRVRDASATYAQRP
jgi:hypothetical protein